MGRRSRQGSRKHRAGLVEEAERGSARGMKRGRGGENAGERTCKHGPKSRREEGEGQGPRGEEEARGEEREEGAQEIGLRRQEEVGQGRGEEEAEERGRARSG